METSFNGLVSIRRFLYDWIRAFDGYDVLFDEVHDFGDGVILIAVREAARPAGASSDVRLRELAEYVVVWSGKRITQVTVYAGGDEARAAAERLASERG